MVSFKAAVLAFASAGAVVADYVIDPDTVPLAMRMSWCSDETATCPLICMQTGDGSTLENDCNPYQLTYSCVCGDGKQPNVSEYSLTLPYHVCRQFVIQCVADCNGDNMCQGRCQQDHLCGAQEPKRINVTSTSSRPSTASPSSTDASGKIHSGIGGDGSDNLNDDPDSGARALEFGRSYGLVVVAAGLFAGFGLML